MKGGLSRKTVANRRNKNSVLIGVEHLLTLQDLLKSKSFTNLATTSRFQIYHGEFKEKTISLYKSGILTFDPELDDTIASILQEIGMKFHPTKPRGKKKVVTKGDLSSVWLTDSQMGSLFEYFNKTNHMITNRKASKIITANDSPAEIQISPNGIVSYYEHESFAKVLEKIIQDQIHFEGHTYNLGIGSYGIKSVFGSIVVSFCIIDKDQAIFAQQNGVRNPNSSRVNDPEKTRNLIEKMNIPIFSMIFTPNQINDDLDFVKTFTSAFKHELTQFTSNRFSVKIYIDPSDPLSEILSNHFGDITIVNPEHSSSSIANTISSNLAAFEFQEWKKSVEKSLGYYISSKLSIEIKEERNLVFHEFIPLTSH